MTTGKPWTTQEVEIITTAYAEMLYCELSGVKYSKARYRREVLPRLEGRSAGSYEFKCCNISAALLDSGYPYINGYKPRAGYQRSLKAAAVYALGEGFSSLFSPETPTGNNQPPFNTKDKRDDATCAGQTGSRTKARAKRMRKPPFSLTKE